MAKKASKKPDKKEPKKIIERTNFVSARQALEECRKLTAVPFSPAVDEKTGGGFLEGSLILMRTKAKVGKSTSAMQLVHNALSQGRYVFYVDVENRLYGDKYFQIEGFDLDNPKFQIIRSNEEKLLSGEEIYGDVMTIMKTPKYKGSLIIIDSFSKITTQETLDDSNIRYDRRDSTPRLNADFCKKAGNLLRSSKCIILGMQHWITNTSPGAMGGLVADGGVKLIYESCYVLECKHNQLGLDGESIALEKNESELDGQMIKWDLPVNKMLAPYVSKDPNSKIESYIKFGTGIWWAKEALSVLENLGIVSRGGAWYEFLTDIELPKVQGANAAIETIENNKDYFKSILKKYYEETYNINYNFTPTEEQEAE